MELAPGVHRVDGIFPNNVYLLTEGDLTLIDSGFPGNGRRIVNYVRKIGRDPEELKLVVATHHHPDHTGSLRQVKSLTGAWVAAHGDDAPYLSQRELPWRTSSSAVHSFILWSSQLFLRVHPVDMEVELAEGDLLDALGGLRVLHTPGHTPGSICLYSKERGVLFSGDTVQYSRGKLRRALSIYSWNPELEVSSILRVAQLKFDLLLPGDGKPLLGGADKRVRKFVAAHLKPDMGCAI